MNKLKLIQPELILSAKAEPKKNASKVVPDFVVGVDARPNVITTETSEEFAEVCARAKAGEFFISSVSVGRTPAEWVCRVVWPNEKAQQ